MSSFFHILSVFLTRSVNQLLAVLVNLFGAIHFFNLRKSRKHFQTFFLLFPSFFMTTVLQNHTPCLIVRQRYNCMCSWLFSSTLAVSAFFSVVQKLLAYVKYILLVFYVMFRQHKKTTHCTVSRPSLEKYYQDNFRLNNSFVCFCWMLIFLKIDR